MISRNHLRIGVHREQEFPCYLIKANLQSVVQYYVPYLSAIQLYGQSAKKSYAKPRLSIHDKHNTMQEGFSSDDSENKNPQDLLFEYFDHDPLISYEPLTDKILDLAHEYPSLKSLRSYDLLPASWMFVA
ncbi:hypothetical protein RJT34_12552 [Clitoria ternatea]|uniref:Uncharacterized protein n=1 Tax=Clitoria ternatea TaxID=43366 RepID=A0AAN9JP49_CLITE